MAAGDQIDALLLFILYNWICCLCNKAIDPQYRCPDLRAATIEHMIPLSQGGTHTWANVQPAHAECNFKKSNNLRLGVDQGDLDVVH